MERDPASAPSSASDGERYGISAAADRVGTGVQNLRAYESRGLVEPERTEGGTRRYSEHDITRLRHISTLLGEGLNLAGISRVLDLEAQVATLLAENTLLRADDPRHGRGPG